MATNGLLASLAHDVVVDDVGAYTMHTNTHTNWSIERSNVDGDDNDRVGVGAPARTL